MQPWEPAVLPGWLQPRHYFIYPANTCISYLLGWAARAAVVVGNCAHCKLKAITPNKPFPYGALAA